MGSSLVIVALPAEDDIVNKISSEKVPHLTLLYLGDVGDASDVNLTQMEEFVGHAVKISEHGPFYLEVDHRGELGDDKADVLFFRGGWETKWIKQLRGQLLQQPDIRTAYDKANKFPEWLPHLTLGYPETPANPFPENHHYQEKIYSVSFDRIAIWMDDFDGPEFRLKWPEREEDMECGPLAYSAMGKDIVEELMEHHGVKGMQWGQRKTETVSVGGQTKAVTPKKAAKLDKAWEKQIYTVPGAIKVHNAMADHFNQRIGSLNDRYKDNDFSGTKWDNPSSWTPREKQYMHEVDKLTLEGTRHAVNQVHGKSPTGKLSAELSPDGDHISVRETKLKHAADDVEEFLVFKIKRNSDGLITGVELMEDEMAQTVDLGVEFIEHHGTKGMKWGVRRDPVTGVRPIAKALDKSKFGKASQANVDRYNRKHADKPGGMSKTSRAGAKTIDAGAATVKGAKKVGDHITDQNFKRNANSSNNITKLVGAASVRTKKNDLPAINEKHKALAKTSKRVHLSGPSRVPAQKAYRADVRKAYEKNLNDIANETKSRSGNLQYKIGPAAISGKQTATRWRVKTVQVKHDVMDELEFDIILIEDADGFITDFKHVPVEEELAQTAIHGAVFTEGLMHSGVKGMRWGQRKETPAAVAPVASSKIPHGDKRKTKIEVAGGQNHPAAEDAIKVAQARAKLAKSGPAALSNKELQDIASRVELEARVSRVTQSPAKKFVTNLLKQQGAAELGTRINVDRQQRLNPQKSKAAA